MWGSRGDDSFGTSLQRTHAFVRERDRSGFLDRLHEDGAFGAETAVAGDGTTLLSRDLLDSANELCFLEEELELSRWPEGTGVLDIGAGYGRLCHRMGEALPHLSLIATDGVPESLALAESYLAHRGAEARVVPPAQLAETLAATPARLAVAVHSLPEMSSSAVAWWLRLLSDADVRELFVVSNAPALGGVDASVQLHSDGGEPLLDALRAAGWRLRRAQPKYRLASPLAPGIGGRTGCRWRRRDGDAELAYAACTHLLFERAPSPPPSRSLPPPPPPPARCGAMVISLARRADRRQWMEATALAPLRAIGVDAQVVDAHDAAEGGGVVLGGVAASGFKGWRLDEGGLRALAARWRAAGLAAVQHEELRLYHGRDVSCAELACLASHARAWRAADEAGLDWVLVLEDDVMPADEMGCGGGGDGSGGGGGGGGGGDGGDGGDGGGGACWRSDGLARRWARVWLRLCREVAVLEASEPRPRRGWELLYLGRNRLGSDGAAAGDRLVEPGFSSCAHAYALSRRGYRRLLRLLPRVAQSAVAVDELLPALYAPHPRADVAEWAAELLGAEEGAEPEGEGPTAMRAFAFRHDLVWQLETVATGAAHERLSAAGGGVVSSAPASLLCRSDIRPVDAARRGASLAARALQPRARAAQPGLFDEEVGEWPPSLQAETGDTGGGVRAELPPPLLPWWAWLLVAAQRREAWRALGGVCRGLHTLMRRQQLWRAVLLRRTHAAALALAPAHVLSSEVEAQVRFCGSWRESLTWEVGDGSAGAEVAAEAAVAVEAEAGRGVQEVGEPLLPAWPAKAAQLPSIRVCDAESPSAAAFRRLFCPRSGAGEPLLLRGAPCIAPGEAAGVWSKAGLVAAFGPRSFTVVDQSGGGGPTRCRMQLLEYVAYMHVQERRAEARTAVEAMAVEAESDDEPLSLFEWDLPPELLHAVRPPSQLEDDLLELLAVRDATPPVSGDDDGGGGDDDGGGGDDTDASSAVGVCGSPDLLQERRWLLMGPAGAGSRWHVDPHATCAYNLLLEGRKLWCLAPPAAEDASEVLPPGVEVDGCLVHAPASLRWFRGELGGGGGGRGRGLLWVEQAAGEVVCVPRGWWHTTLNLEGCVAFTQNVVLPGAGARAAIRALEETGDAAQAEVARRLREVVGERHA